MLILRTTILALIALLACGCSSTRVDLRVLSNDGSPVTDLHVEAHAGPYFADLRGPFGIYDDTAVTNEAGEACFKLKVPGYCRINFESSENLRWSATISRGDMQDDDQWVQVKATHDNQTANSADNLLVWMRIRD